MEPYKLITARAHERACFMMIRRHCDNCAVCRTWHQRPHGSPPVCELRSACEAEARLAQSRRVAVELQEPAKSAGGSAPA